MQRDELSREIIRKFEKDVYELYKSAWHQIDKNADRKIPPRDASRGGTL